jgi:hypothetical protein
MFIKNNRLHYTHDRLQKVVCESDKVELAYSSKNHVDTPEQGCRSCHFFVGFAGRVLISLYH